MPVGFNETKTVEKTGYTYRHATAVVEVLCIFLCNVKSQKDIGFTVP